jgi:zinc protease
LKQVKMWQQDDYFTDEQLADAKGIMRRNDIRKKEKPSELAHDLTYNWCSTSLDYLTDYPRNCMNVTRQDIKNYISKYITAKPYVAGIIINAEMNKAAQTSTFFKPSL